MSETQIAIDALRFQIERDRRAGLDTVQQASELAVVCNLADEPLPINLPEIEMTAGQVPPMEGSDG